MKNLLFALFTIASVLISSQLQANNDRGPIPNAEKNTEPVDLKRVQVNIFVQVKKNTSKGIICEIMSIVLGDGNALRKNQLAATAEIQGEKLSLKLDKSSTKVTQLIMPKGFKLSREVSLKLGSKNPVVMSGGSTMVKRDTNSLLWFEIQ